MIETPQAALPRTRIKPEDVSDGLWPVRLASLGDPCHPFWLVAFSKSSYCRGGMLEPAEGFGL